MYPPRPRPKQSTGVTYIPKLGQPNLLASKWVLMNGKITTLPPGANTVPFERDTLFADIAEQGLNPEYAAEPGYMLPSQGFGVAEKALTAEKLKALIVQRDSIMVDLLADRVVVQGEIRETERQLALDTTDNLAIIEALTQMQRAINNQEPVPNNVVQAAMQSSMPPGSTGTLTESSGNRLQDRYGVEDQFGELESVNFTSDLLVPADAPTEASFPFSDLGSTSSTESTYSSAPTFTSSEVEEIRTAVAGLATNPRLAQSESGRRMLDLLDDDDLSSISSVESNTWRANVLDVTDQIREDMVNESLYTIGTLEPVVDSSLVQNASLAQLIQIAKEKLVRIDQDDSSSESTFGSESSFGSVSTFGSGSTLGGARQFPTRDVLIARKEEVGGGPVGYLQFLHNEDDKLARALQARLARIEKTPVMSQLQRSQDRALEEMSNMVVPPVPTTGLMSQTQFQF